MSEREIGGYLELERSCGSEYHQGALALNCARNCLAYLIEARGIRRLLVPSFLCASVSQTAGRYDIDVVEYPIGADFAPLYDQVDLGGDGYLYLVNYYGQLSDERIREAKRLSGGRLIVDEVMNFYHMPVDGLDTIYSCRKFFGVPDGGYLYTSARIGRPLPADQSFDRMGFVLGRFERTANEFYPQAAANNSFFVTEPIKTMSPITHNLLRAVDYDRVAERRAANFAYLHHELADVNELSPTQPVGAFMYPLLVRDGMSIRKRLQARKVYVSTLWPFATDKPGYAGRYARDILPLPVDQRYDADDMAYVCRLVREEMGRD